MPSQLHEALLLLFRIRPALAPELLHEALGVAAWAARPIELGGGNLFMPNVVGPAGVPVIMQAKRARQDPDLAVLSAMAHGRDADVGRSLDVALAAIAASARLDAERANLYFDLVAASLSEAARKALLEMDPAKHKYQSDFARRYIAEGEARAKAEGKADGKAEGKAEMLARRFGRLPDRVRERLAAASSAYLDRCAERVLDAGSIDEVFTDR